MTLSFPRRMMIAAVIGFALAVVIFWFGQIGFTPVMPR